MSKLGRDEIGRRKLQSELMENQIEQLKIAIQKQEWALEKELPLREIKLQYALSAELPAMVRGAELQIREAKQEIERIKRNIDALKNSIK